MISTETWETLLFFSSIFFTLMCVALVFGAGASIVLWDWNPVKFSFIFWCIAAACVVITGARVEA